MNWYACIKILGGCVAFCVAAMNSACFTPESANEADTEPMTGATGPGTADTSTTGRSGESDTKSEAETGGGTDTETGVETGTGTETGLESATQTGSSSGSGDETGPPDLEAPWVVSFSPEDGAEGIRSDDPIVLEFSESMDRDSVEAAFSGDLPGVEFSWNPDGSRLTVTATDGFPYAEGTNLAVLPALEFSYALGEQATDEAGNPIEDGVEATFTTLRRILVSIEEDPALSAGLFADGTIVPTVFYVGDSGSNERLVTAVSFALPSEKYADGEFERATLLAAQTVVQDPYAPLGDLELDVVVFDDLAEAYDAAAKLTLGSIATSGDEDVAADVSDVAEAAVDAGAERTQFRFLFELGSNGDFISNYLVLPTDSVTLEISFLFE